VLSLRLHIPDISGSLPQTNFLHATNLVCSFSPEFVSVESPVVFTHWRLLSNVCKRESREKWQHMAVKVSGNSEKGGELARGRGGGGSREGEKGK